MKKVLQLILEAGTLKHLQRSGWSVVGVPDAETVGAHCFRCAIIAYVLARSERIPSERAVLMALFNDIQEARITDMHKMAQRYIDATAAEDSAYYEQIRSLPQALKSALQGLHREYRAQRSKASIVARDADILECLIQAREYYEQGYRQAAKFMKKAPQHLKTKSARKLWQAARQQDISAWWFGLSDFRR